MNSETGIYISDSTTVEVSENVLFQDVGGEIVLLDIARGEYYGLNQVGSRIWALIQQGCDVSAVVGALLNEYDVTEDCLRADVHQFLSRLQEKGLIETNAGQAN